MLFHLTKGAIGDKYKLIIAVMNSLTDGYSASAGDITVPALLWVYTVQHYQFKDVFVAISKNRNHCLIQQIGYKVDKLGMLRYVVEQVIQLSAINRLTVDLHHACIS